jgi:hypothetical protein
LNVSTHEIGPGFPFQSTCEQNRAQSSMTDDVVQTAFPSFRERPTSESA